MSQSDESRLRAGHNDGDGRTITMSMREADRLKVKLAH
jgi:hypothetical protein